MTESLVTAVMVTGKDPGRLPLAIRAGRCCLQQSHRHLELLIVTDGFSLVDQLPADSRVREIRVLPGLSLGELRNRALDAARGDFIVQFDDDDWSLESRIAAQLQASQATGLPVTLRRQVRYSFETDNAFVAERFLDQGKTVGIVGTILHPRTALRYPALGKHEDSHFAKGFPAVHVLDNPPQMYLRFQHGRNTWNRKHIMGKFDTGNHRWQLPDAAKAVLRRVLLDYHKDVKHAPARGKTSPAPRSH